MRGEAEKSLSVGNPEWMCVIDTSHELAPSRPKAGTHGKLVKHSPWVRLRGIARPSFDLHMLIMCAENAHCSIPLFPGYLWCEDNSYTKTPPTETSSIRFIVQHCIITLPPCLSLYNNPTSLFICMQSPGLPFPLHIVNSLILLVLWLHQRALSIWW